MASRYDPAVCSGRYAGEPRWPMTIGRRPCPPCRREPPRASATPAPPERPKAAAPATPRLSIDLRENPGIALRLPLAFAVDGPLYPASDVLTHAASSSASAAQTAAPATEFAPAGRPSTPLGLRPFMPSAIRRSSQPGSAAT